MSDAGAGAKGGAVESHTAEGEDEDARVQATFVVAKDRVRVHYRVAAKVGKRIKVEVDPKTAEPPLLLFDRLVGEDEDTLVAFEPPATLALKRIVPPLPTWKSVELPIEPKVRPIARGTTVQAELEVALPAAEFNPYFPEGYFGRYEDVSATILRLVLGYGLERRETKLAPVKEVPGFFEVVSGGTDRRELAVSVALRRPVPVRRRTDDFESP